MDVRLAVTGFGNVGQGLATLLAQYGDRYEREFGLRFLLTGVADRGGAVTHRNGLDPRMLLSTKERDGTVAACTGGEAGLDGDAFLDRAGADILVEAASTNFEDAEPGWSYIRGALARNWDVVLASKGALALHYGQLMEEARRHDRSVRFSATVGAPVPGLQLADRVLIGSEIESFEGILNGTTHQILTAMSEGASYDEGVRQAQAMGIAETDPTLDVDGWDAAAKVCIVANAVFGTDLTLSDVRRTGIRDVSADDLAAAQRRGERIKLIGRAARVENEVEASVAPEPRPMDDALGRLSGDAMGIVFTAEPLGVMACTFEVSRYGGGISTAMTVLRDIFNGAHDRGWIQE